ncbi:unnamed protein product [Clonostachys solani]|uniref:Spindle pole body-associated protein cut12 domain-containing protein n=1 Tax=Clonostachys solani TaxID=160281 RepID=A0A9P0EQY5_9HYPO|nr:unnamed protein product [Clonostachys solani]
MLGWMLNRGENAPNGLDEGDTTQIDQPDTPAPVFAARAFRNALFGTPANSREELRARPAKSVTISGNGSRTPNSKPQGILLTPGTGTSRPKRVSFGRDVGGGSKLLEESSQIAIRDINVPKGAKSATSSEATKQEQAAGAGGNVPASDDDWEEDDDDVDPENLCSHDITVDLNEPHSQSGLYWKHEFEKYQQDARTEMEKMLKYKQLAKSYARQKDAEAINLAEKLKTEQQKVIDMEKKITENASQIISRFENKSENASPEVLANLAKQTALAKEYKEQVQDLENQLEEFLEDRQDTAEPTVRRRRMGASPRTQRTLLETQRELRKARNQAKELNDLRHQVSSLKERLKAAEERADQAGSGAHREDGLPRAKELRAQLRQEREESRRKDEEIQQLKKEFEAYREESQAQEKDRNDVLQRAHSKISDLKKEIKTLKSGGADPIPRQNANKQDALEATTGADMANQRSNVAEMRARPRQSEAATREMPDEVISRTPEGSPGKGFTSTRHRTAREKPVNGEFRPRATVEDPIPIAMSGALNNRPVLDKPRWQPFVPRSPRNRAYLGDDLADRIENGGVTVTTKPKDIKAPDLPALAELISRSERPPSRLKMDAGIDLLHDRFAKLGAPEVHTNRQEKRQSATRDTSNSKLPPERRAAALARIEKRIAMKKMQKQNDFDKENVQPA